MPRNGVASIPLDELAERVYELPDRHLTVNVIDSENAEAAARWLNEHGWAAEVAPLTERDSPEGRARLWSPNPFLTQVAPEIPPGKAVDLGCGVGREAVALAAAGWDVVGIDRLPDALKRASCLAERYLPDGCGTVDWNKQDLRRHDPRLAGVSLVTMFFFMDQDVLRHVASTLPAKGNLLVEAFTRAHRAEFGKPANATTTEELKNCVAELRIKRLEEGWIRGRHTVRLWATR